MKALVVFDSNLGNTKIIAETIAKELGEDAKAISSSDLNIKDLEGIDLIVAGSPIIGWKPTEKMDKFLSDLNRDQLKGIKAASFDTRVKLFIHGDAMNKISEKLKNAGAEIIVKPQAFFVEGKETVLAGGEIEKAREWVKSIKTKFE
ncbi:MAG: flavodoxin family protein [Candidatus Humimicrobiaceae bacterium]